MLFPNRCATSRNEWKFYKLTSYLYKHVSTIYFSIRQYKVTSMYEKYVRT